MLGAFALAGCGVEADNAFDPVFLTANGLDLKIYFEPDLIYAPVAEVENGDGTVSIIEPIYVPGGLAVARVGGLSLVDSDEANAREAAEYYCAKMGERPITFGFADVGDQDSLRVWQFQGCDR